VKIENRSEEVKTPITPAKRPREPSPVEKTEYDNEDIETLIKKAKLLEDKIRNSELRIFGGKLPHAPRNH
jgi:hypothetical protein